jgi:hypothetical protein
MSEASLREIHNAQIERIILKMDGDEASREAAVKNALRFIPVVESAFPGIHTKPEISLAQDGSIDLSWNSGDYYEICGNVPRDIPEINCVARFYRYPQFNWHYVFS